MAKSFIKILTLTTFLTIPLVAGNFETKIISSIIIMGNESTNESVIKRELLFNIGDSFSDSLMLLSEKRITNLLLFNHVEIIPVPGNNGVTILINVTERLFLFPFPKFTVEDRDWDKISYGFGLAHTNFRGQNEKLIATILFGYRPGYQLDYYNPWISNTNHISVGFNVWQYETSHKVFDFTQTHFILSGNIGKYWTRYFYNTLSVALNNLNVPQEISILMPTGTNEEKIVSLSFSTVYDNRDLIAYPSNGWYASAEFQKFGFFEDKINYDRYLLELRNYHTFSNIILAGRIHTTISNGKLPLYDKVYFGFNERIRGHFSDVIAGKHLAIGSFETRFPLISPFWLNFPSPFLPESSTKNLKFGLNGAIFYDAGKVWNRLEEYSNVKYDNYKNIIQGYGFSLHFLLPYVEVARLELAFNENMDSEFIFELGTSF